LERSDLTDAGGLPPRRRAVGREQCFNKAKLIPVAAPHGNQLSPISCRSSTEFKKEAAQWLSFYLKKPRQATEAMRWMNLPQLPGAAGGAGARGGHLERSDLAGAGGLPPGGGP